MATMATAIFVTKQQPTVNIVISITQVVVTILADECIFIVIDTCFIVQRDDFDQHGLSMMSHPAMATMILVQ
jgi:hypothetical protein